MKYAILSGYETNYDVLMDILYESENLIQDDDEEMNYPFIVLTSKEYKEWMKVKEAYEMWQERFSEADYESTVKPREPFQTMEDVEREMKEFLK
jgi:hypothetical protein